MFFLMVDPQFDEEINRELAIALSAQANGNHGRARVCARRAAGVAIGWYLRMIPHQGWGENVMSRLEHLKADNSFPENVRDAADRLSMKITNQFSYPSGHDPVRDAGMIIACIRGVLGEHDGP